MLKTKNVSNLNIIIFEIVCCLFYFLKIAFIGILDTDVFYLLAVGKDILKNGISHINTLITTPDTPVVLQNWAYCALLAIVENISGRIGLYILMLLFLLALYLVIRKNVHDVIHNKWIAFFCTFVLTNSFGYLNLRPEILTFLLLYFEVYGIQQYQKTQKKRYLIYIPLSMLLEINFHASYWILHYIVILPFIVPLIDDKIRETALRSKERNLVLIVALLSFPVLFMNPYGIDNILYVFKACFSDTFKIIQIKELQPIAINSLCFTPLILISILFFAYGLWEKHNPPYLTSTSVWMWLGFLILTIKQIKWYPFFVFGFLFLFHDIGHLFEEWILNSTKNIHIKESVQSFLCILIIFVFLLCDISKNDIHQVKLLCENASLTDLYFSQDDSRYADEWKTVISIIKKNPDGVFSASFKCNNLFSYEEIPVYLDIRPEIYTEKDENGVSILSRTMMISDMKNRNEDAEEDTYINEKEYAALVHELNVRYFFINENGRGSLLNLYLSEHPDLFTPLYKGNGMSLYERKQG